jgi:hypothetical protein
MTTSGDATHSAQGDISGARDRVSEIQQETPRGKFSTPERAILARYVEEFKISNREARTNMMKQHVFPAFRALNLGLNGEQWSLRKGVR